MRMNMILGKKQIVLASLVLVLGVAVYLNWQFAQADKGFPVTGQLTSSDKNLGDAEFVNGTTDDTDFFAEAKVNRQQARDTAIQTLSTLLKDSELSVTEKADATAQAVQIAKLMDSESKIENLIKAKGFTECVAYADGEKVDVIVQTDELVASEAAQIKDIIVTEAKITADKIKITPVK